MSDIQDIVENAEEFEKLDKTKPRPIKWKKIAFWTFFIVVNASVLVFTLLNDFVGNDYSVAITVIWWWLVFALLAVIGTSLFRALAYTPMMHLLTGKTRFGLCLSITIVGGFYDKTTPLGTGGQPFQIHYMQKKNLLEGTATALPIMEYVLGRLIFVLLTLAAIILNALNVFGGNITLVTGIYVAAIIGLVLNLLIPTLLMISLFSKKGCRKTTKFIVLVAKFLRLTKNPSRLYRRIMTKLNANVNCLKLLIKNKRLILSVLFLLGSKLAAASVGYFVIKAFGFYTTHGFGWAEIVVLNMLIVSAVSFFPTPGGSGAADLSFYWVYSTALLASTGIASGAIATLVWRLLSYYLIILVGFVFIMIVSRKKITQKIDKQLPHSQDSPKQI